MRLLYVVPYLNDPAVHRRIRMLLLGGATPGQYGVKKTAKDGVLPQIPLAATGG